MIVTGIDPGSVKFGLATIELHIEDSTQRPLDCISRVIDYRVVKVPSSFRNKTSKVNGMGWEVFFAREIAKYILNFYPEHVIIERNPTSFGYRSAIRMLNVSFGIAVGVTSILCKGEKDISVTGISTWKWSEMVVGRKVHKKEERHSAIADLLSSIVWDTAIADTIDALEAICIAAAGGMEVWGKIGHGSKTKKNGP